MFLSGNNKLCICSHPLVRLPVVLETSCPCARVHALHQTNELLVLSFNAFSRIMEFLISAPRICGRGRNAKQIEPTLSQKNRSINLHLRCHGVEKSGCHRVGDGQRPDPGPDRRLSAPLAGTVAACVGCPVGCSIVLGLTHSCRSLMPD